MNLILFRLEKTTPKSKNQMKNRATFYVVIFGRFVIRKLFPSIDEPENPTSTYTHKAQSYIIGLQRHKQESYVIVSL